MKKKRFRYLFNEPPNIKSEKSTQYSAKNCKTLHTFKGNDVLIKHALIRAFYSIYNG